MTYNPDVQISSLWKLGYALMCLAVFGIFALNSQADRGVVASFSAASIVLAAKLRWDAANRFWFWATLTAIVIIHAVIVYLWGRRIDVKPTILLAPIALLDIIIVISVFFVVERLLIGHQGA